MRYKQGGKSKAAADVTDFGPWLQLFFNSVKGGQPVLDNVVHIARTETGILKNRPSAHRSRF